MYFTIPMYMWYDKKYDTTIGSFRLKKKTQYLNNPSWAPMFITMCSNWVFSLKIIQSKSLYFYNVLFNWSFNFIMLWLLISTHNLKLVSHNSYLFRIHLPRVFIIVRYVLKLLKFTRVKEYQTNKKSFNQKHRTHKNVYIK